MAATETLRIIVESKKKGTGAEDAKKGLDSLTKMVKAAATAFAAMKSAQAAVEFVRLGAEALAVGDRFRAFAGSTQEAQGYLEAMGRASEYTLDKMSAMAGASKLLQMGLVDNSAEMETMAAVAVRLGDQTMSAGDRIADFAALLANRSIPRLDNFGLASGRVRQRVEELKAAGHGLDEAFKLAVLEEGTKSLAKLGDTSQSLYTQIGQAQAAWSDFKVTLAESSAVIVHQTGLLGKFSEGMRAWANTATNVKAVVEHTSAARERDNAVLRAGIYAQGAQQATMAAAQRQHEAYQIAMALTTQATDAQMVADRAYRQEQDLLAATTGVAAGSFASYQAALENSRAAEEAAIHATNMHRDAMAQIAAQAVETQGFILDTTMSWQTHFDSVADQAAVFSSTMTGLETEHQANVAQIVQSGQDERTAIDIAAEEAQLASLQAHLASSMAELTLYNANASAEDTAAKAEEVARLTEQVATQEQMVGDFYAGRLGNLTENAALMLAEENARYAEEQRIQAEAQAALEAEQMASLGRMVLQAFDSWASMKGIAAADALEMRTAIAQEYGLIDSETARTVGSMVSLWEGWAAGTAGSTADAIASMNGVVGQANRTKSAIEAIPAYRKTTHRHEEHTHKYTHYHGGGGGSDASQGDQFTAQHGTMYAPGGMALVGERGPEMMYVPRGAKIWDAMKTQRMAGLGGGVGISATFNVYPAAGMDEEALARKVMRVMDVKLLRNRVEQQARLRGQGRAFLG